MLSVIVTYLVLLISWGIYQGRKVKTGSDYSIAGRNLPGWAAALSERATGESSWALLGLPGAAYAGGLLFTIVWQGGRYGADPHGSSRDVRTHDAHGRRRDRGDPAGVSAAFPFDER